MKIVLALGGNALLRRGEPQGAAQQLANIERAAAQIALIAGAEPAHQLVITHGNGPQVGLLALQAAAYATTSNVPAYPLDVLGAETEGMVGYLLEQGLSNRLPGRTVATLVTRTEVSLADPAFQSPSKPIGPVYSADEAARITRERGWVVAAENAGAGRSVGMRRVVASPAPLRVLSLQAIEWLLSHGAIVIAAGGGGVPVAMQPTPHGATVTRALAGVEAVVDKDATSSLLARSLGAECLLIATDVPALYFDFGLPTQRALHRVSTAAIARTHFAPGSMAPKVQAACDFVNATGARAVIGSLDDIDAMMRGDAGTQIRREG